MSDDDWNASSEGQRDEKIPLQRCWSFWFYSRASSEENGAIGKGLVRLEDFDTIQDFWACYNALPSPLLLGPLQRFHLMKQGITPEREDEFGKKGGVWTFKVDKTTGEDVWLLLLLALIGEQFTCVLPRSDEILGVTVKAGPATATQLTFQVWHKEEDSRGLVYDKLKSVLMKLTDLSNSFYRSTTEELRRSQQSRGESRE
eukprot:RCo037866